MALGRYMMEINGQHSLQCGVYKYGHGGTGCTVSIYLSIYLSPV